MFQFNKRLFIRMLKRPIALLLSGLLCLWSFLPSVSAEEYGNTDPSWYSAHGSDLYRGTGSESLSSIPAPPSDISAQAAVLMEASSGDILYKQNSNAKLPMASTTKVMTALVALDLLSPDTEVTITAESVGIEGSSIYLCEGESLTVEELLYALLLASANDAATAIAIAAAGSVEAFAERMNAKACALGLQNTHFVNPHGLDDPQHYTTALELAIITREALSNPLIRHICATKKKTIPLHGEEGVRLLINHNRLLSSLDGCIGGKTGYTKKAGRCLVSAAERDGVTLIAVTLNAPDDWRDHTSLHEYGLGVYEEIELCRAGDYSAPLWVESGTAEYTIIENRDALSVSLRRDHGEIICVTELPRFEFAPVASGEALGYLRFFEIDSQGQTTELGAVPLYACYGVESQSHSQGFFSRIRKLLHR